LCDKRFQILIQIEDRVKQIDDKLKLKAKLIRQKNEIQNLLRAVENNIQPTEFKNKIGALQSSDEEEA